MEFTGDFHMHSKYSDGRATVPAMVAAARQKSLEAIAITDHGPNNIGTGVKNSETFLQIKKEVKALNDEYPDIKLLCGCEADIVGLNGEIDVPKDIYQELDLLIVGLHPFARPEKLQDIWALNGSSQLARVSAGSRRKAVNTNTKTLIAAMDSHPVDIISHPGLGMPVDVSEVAEACVRNEVLFEINCGHHHPPLDDVLEAHSKGVEFIVDSDAHFTESVGLLDYGNRVLTQAGIPPERVLNSQAGGKTRLWEK